MPWEQIKKRTRARRAIYRAMNNQTRNLMFSSNEMEYGTPKEIFDHYDSIYHFTLDVCATAKNTKVPGNYYTKEQNCLIQDWGTNICWMNPPYNKPENACPDDESKCKKKGCEKRGYHIHEYNPGQVDFVAKAADAAKKELQWSVYSHPGRTQQIFSTGTFGTNIGVE